MDFKLNFKARTGVIVWKLHVKVWKDSWELTLTLNLLILDIVLKQTICKDLSGCNIFKILNCSVEDIRYAIENCKKIVDGAIICD